MNMLRHIQLFFFLNDQLYRFLNKQYKNLNLPDKYIHGHFVNLWPC